MDDSPRDVTLDAVEAVFTLAMDAGAPESFVEFSGKVDPQTGDTTLKLDTWEGVIAGADIAAAIGASVKGEAAPAQKPGAEDQNQKPGAPAPAQG